MSSAKRRLDMGSGSDAKESKKVRNPYLKKDTQAQSSTNDAPSTVTPEAGIERFFVSKKPGEFKPRAARRLIPRDEPKLVPTGQKRPKSPEDDSVEEDREGRYYHSDQEERKSKIRKNADGYDPPAHMQASLDYGRRGEVPFGQGTLKAYRFVRENFLVPLDIEADPKFGPYSGSCFEERVIRAYSLGQLEPKGGVGEDALVCSYCGEEGHKREGCLELL
ncbi:hypothetical protein ACHAXT_003891 [Thalassiosira profunda]